MQIRLSTDEHGYLLRDKFLPERLLALLQEAKKPNPSTVILEISIDQVDEFRDAFGDRMQEVGFDANYQPTPEGEILESLVDRFYIGKRTE